MKGKRPFGLLQDSAHEVPAQTGAGLLRRHRLILISLLLLVGGALFAWWLAARAESQMREDLLAETRLIASAVSIDRVEALSGTEADLQLPDYLLLKQQLQTVTTFDPDYRFVYLMGYRQDGTAFFYADSEPVGSADYTPPGEEYEEVSAELRQALTDKTALVEGPVSDRWGEWVSALVPLSGADSSDITALLGVDVDAGSWRWQVVEHSILPAGAFVLALVVILWVGAWQLARRAKRETPPSWLQAWVEVAVTVTVCLVVTGFCVWLVAYEYRSDQRHSFANMAASRTAIMDDAFGDIWGLELEGVAGLYESSEYVTAAEFERYTAYLTREQGVHAWEWAPAVLAADVQAFESAARAEGLSEFQIWEEDSTGARVPAAGREVYYPIFRVMPGKAGQMAIGFDLGSEPVSQVAIAEALTTGLTTATEPMTLVLKADVLKGMQVFRPVFTAAGQDRPRASGLVVAVLRFDDALRAMGPDDVVAMRLFEVHIDGFTDPLADSEVTIKSPDSALTLKRPVFAFNKTFMVLASAGPAFDRLSLVMATISTTLAGLVLTVALGLVVWLTRRRRLALEGLLEKGTSALRETEERYRNILEVAPVGIGVLQNEKVVFANPAAQRLMGASTPEDLVGKDLTSIVHPDDLAAADEWAARLAGVDRGLYPSEVRLARLDGSVIDAEILASNLAYQGEPAIQVIATDVTERKRSEEVRRQREAELQRVIRAIEQTGEAVVITDTAGSIQYVNPAFELITGYARDEVLGKNPRILSSDQQEAEFYRQLWSTIAGGHVWEGRMVNRRKDGSLYTEESTISPVKDAEGRILNYVAVKRDITETLRLGEEKAQLQEQLLQAQKLESIGRLAGGVAHDFNNMLSVMIGYGETILSQLSEQDPLRESVQQIVSAGNRSATLVGQLLAFGRKQTLQPTVLDLNEVIRDLEPMLRRMAGEDIEVRVELAEDGGRVLADRGQLQQVIMNLVANARDAMPTGGKLLMETAPVVLDGSYTQKHPGVTPGQYALLVVTDTGSGMDKETLSQVFDPFFTTKEHGRGTGLGLATVYGIVKQSGGSIWAYSELGEGTTFKVYLPRTDAAAEPARADDFSAGPTGGGELILVVEDEDSLRGLMAKALARLGYRVTLAANGGEALALMQTEGLAPDLIITDVVMPDMSGKQLIDRLAADQPELRVLYMSGYPDKAVTPHGVLDSGVNYIQKPFSIRDLAKKIQEVLRAG